MNLIHRRTCRHCDKDLTGKHFNAVFCDEICDKNFKIKNKVVKSHRVYTDSNKRDWVECPCCNIRVQTISGQHIKNHGYSKEEFYKTYPGVKLISEKIAKEISVRVSGDKNPAYQHGGRFSPFSKKFVKYQGKSEEELESIVTSLYEKSINTKEENNSNPLTLDYYITRGYSEKESIQRLKERQSTFNFSKCIDRFGEEEGKRIWTERQEKWQNTLKSKPQEEIDDINKRKSTKINYRTLWTMSLDEDGYFYIIDLKNNKYKIGITSKSEIAHRYKKKELVGFDVIIFKKCKDINHAFQIEQLLKNKYPHKIFKNNSVPSNFGWTEVINDIQLYQLIEDTNELLANPEYSEMKFKSTFNLKHVI